MRASRALRVGGSLGLVCVVFALASSGPGPAAAPTVSLRDAQAIVSQVAKIRGLKVRRKVAMGVMTRAQVLARIEHRLRSDYSDEELAKDAAVLARLWLVPQKFDFKRALLALLAEQVAGFYDPQEQRLHIASWVPMSLQKQTLVHEICHALQDQHFRLARLVKPLPEHSDLKLARSALIEGDCTGVMFEYYPPHDLSAISTEQLAQLLGQSIKGPAASKTPFFLRQQLLFPYLAGLRFVQQLRTRQPWTAVNAVFRRLPESTEQILHPDKYAARERPVRIQVKALPALAGYRLLKQDSWGEFQLGLLLGSALDGDTATRAVAGWGGDRLAAYARSDDPQKPPLIVQLSSWDSEADAIEYANGLGHLFAKRCGVATAAAPLLYRKGDEGCTVERRGRLVLALIGAPVAAAPTIAAQTWSHWRVAGRKALLAAKRR